MKELEQYLWETYSDSYQPSIMNETPSTFPNPDMPTITYLGTDSRKTDADMHYLKKNNTDEAIRKNMRKKDFYESEMHNIYNIIVV